MKRIKQKLLDEGFMVHMRSEYEVEIMMKWLENNTSCHWGRYGTPTGSICNWDRYKNQTVVKIGNIRHPQLNYDSLDYFKENYDQHKILSYDDIWENCGGFAECDGGLTFESDITISFERNCNNIIDIHGLMKSLEGYNNDVLFENGSIISIIDTDGNLLTRGKVKYAESEMVMLDLLGLNEEEEEMTKIENRIEELEEKVCNLKLLEKDLRKAVKLDRQSTVLMDKLKKAKYELKRFTKLLKGYEALDNMYVSEVFRNGDYVVVKTIGGKVASSKPDKHDLFNMCSGFAFCNMKLSLDNDYYVHEVNLALKDIEKRGL